MMASYTPFLAAAPVEHFPPQPTLVRQMIYTGYMFHDRLHSQAITTILTNTIDNYYVTVGKSTATELLSLGTGGRPEILARRIHPCVDL